ncbi:two-component response regulator [Frigidibacter mobilis]|uniref:Two-component response regulator n=1 Tax=Frigidibacter mobilis TaxID=1335048 RepID=A0A159Z8A7_9RHOB|nr:two-component response regulator [Frigidibacter mobilis]
MTDGKSTDITAAIGPELPFLRRYARALTGSQTTGDRYAVATLEAILADRTLFEGDLAPRVALFRAFHAIWSSAGAPVAEGGTDALEARAQVHLSGLTRNTREALLLRTIEEMRFDQIAQIMDITQSEAEELITIAMNEMGRTILGDVMIIEDETIIAMDIQSIVQSMGHHVTGLLAPASRPWRSAASSARTWCLPISSWRTIHRASMRSRIFWASLAISR